MTASSDGPGSVPAATGATPLVLLHGLFGDRDNLRGLAQRLQPLLPGHAILRLDLPGHGDAPAVRPLSFARMAEDVAVRIGAALGPSPLHLVGHSLGGKVAMRLAATPAFAERLASLVVLDIAPRAYPPHHRPLIDALTSLDLAAIGSRREADAALSEAVAEPGVRAFVLKGLVRDGERWRWRFDLEAIAADYEREIAAALPAPEAVAPALATLVLAGAASDYVAEDDAAAIRTRLPTALLEWLASAGHWLHAERPDAVATRIAAFVQACEA